MNRGDILDQVRLKRQCNESAKVLKENNSKLESLKEAYKQVNNVKMSGETADKLKKYCSDVVIILNALQTANDSDIIDHNTLAALLGNEYLNGGTILTHKTIEYSQYLSDTSKSSGAYSTARSLEDWRVAEIGYYNYLGWYYSRTAANHYAEYKRWKQKEEWFDNVCALSSTLFQDGTPFRTLALDGMKDLVNDFKNGEYTLRGNTAWKEGLKQLKSQVNVNDKCKENWKNKDGEYNLDVLKEMLDKDSTEISSVEYDALCEALSELPIEDQHKILGDKVQIVDPHEVNYVKGAFNTIGSCGTVGSILKDAYTLGSAVKSGDGDKVTKACITLGKDWMSRFGSYAKNAFSESPNTANTLIGNLKSYSFAETVMGTTDKVIIGSATTAEYAKKAFASEFSGFKWNNAASNATKAERFATAGKNVKVVTKWAGTAISAGVNFVENKEEQAKDPSMSNLRVVGETAIETGTDIVLGAVGTAVAAALLGPAAPAIAVGAASVAVVWGANELVESLTGKDIGEHFADITCNTIEAIGSLGHALVFGG